MITWTKAQRDFVWDGSLRDIYVHSASLSDWSSAYSLISRDYDPVFRIDGQLAELPHDARSIFAERSVHGPLLQAKVGSVCVAFHFFSEDEIEADIDPREVRDEHDFEQLLSFLRALGDATLKDVDLTPENCPERPIVRYSPEVREFRYFEEDRG